MLFFLLSIVSKDILLNNILHTLGQDVDYKRQVDLLSGNTIPNGSNFSELNDKYLVSFQASTGH